jgi:hypothetical protein
MPVKQQRGTKGIIIFIRSRGAASNGFTGKWYKGIKPPFFETSSFVFSDRPDGGNLNKIIIIPYFNVLTLSLQLIRKNIPHKGLNFIYFYLWDELTFTNKLYNDH